LGNSMHWNQTCHAHRRFQLRGDGRATGSALAGELLT
jgi:hypothetical protein